MKIDTDWEKLLEWAGVDLDVGAAHLCQVGEMVKDAGMPGRVFSEQEIGLTFSLLVETVSNLYSAVHHMATCLEAVTEAVAS